MYREWKTGLAGQSVERETDKSKAIAAAEAVRRTASDMLDECDEMARDMASGYVKRSMAASAQS